MPKWRIIESIVKNWYCGAYLQDRGLKVIPTVFWALKSSFSFCFEAIEKHSIVAVSTLGGKKEKLTFMRGFKDMSSPTKELIKLTLEVKLAQVLRRMMDNIFIRIDLDRNIKADKEKFT